MKIKSLFLAVCFAASTLSVSSQISVAKSLKWENPATLVRGTNSSVSAPSFKGAYFPFLPESHMPAFVERYRLPEGHRLKEVQVSGEKFVPLTEEDRLLLAGEKLPSALQPAVEVMAENGKPWAIVTLVPFAVDPVSGQMMKLSSFRLNITTIPDQVTKKNERSYALNSVLSSGDWYKIYINETGIYRLTYDDLKNLGINVNGLNPDMIRIFGNGGRMLPEGAGSERVDDLAENAIKVVTANPGVFARGDYVLFYGQGTLSWNMNPFSARMEHHKHLYADEACYFVTIGPVPGKRIVTDPDPEGDPNYYSVEYTDFRVHENDNVSMIKSGRKWFGEKLDFYSRTFALPSFQFANAVANESAIVRYGLAGRSLAGQISFNILVNGEQVASSSLSKIVSDWDYVREVTTTASFVPGSSKLDVQVRFNPVSSTDIGYIDFVSLNVRCMLKYSGGQLAFRDPKTVSAGRITSFTLDNAVDGLEIWDVTDPADVKFIQPVRVGNQYIFRRNTERLVEMIAHDNSVFKQVKPGEKVKNQNLHSTGNYDLIIVTHPDFNTDAARLAAAHNNKGEISAIVVPLPEIYNEFSSGVQDITAIRDFMKMLYDRGRDAGYPKYLLLFGNASYDVKNRVAGNSIFIPTYQSENSVHLVNSFLTDDYYGLLDDGEGALNAAGLLDVGVGRLPVRNAEQSKIVTDKILHYLENPASTHGDWRNVIVVPADDEDRNTHLNQAEKLVNSIDTLDPVYNINKIYFDTYKKQSTPGGGRYPDVNREIASRVEKGALLVNYVGHGGEVGWADERVLEISDINAWTNYERMGLFFTATCEFSRFDNPLHTSAGELVFLNPEGGAMSMITTTRLAFASSNSQLNLSFADTLLDADSHEIPRLGDVLKYTKNTNGNSPNTRHLTLFGDPSMRLPIPRHRVYTTSITNAVTGNPADTLFANSLVTVSGEVRRVDGSLIDDFDGVVYVKVFDKPSKVKTLGQHPDSWVVEVKVQKNIVYQGKASVSGGKFTFTFPVPRDIDYALGNGKISYYASNGIEDAHGYSNEFKIGGSVSQTQDDLTGPQIRLFLNDTSFVDGGLTGENPKLIAYLYDESGINTVGNGIGHDIVATIDGNSYDGIVLNDYYSSDLDSYQSGVVNYQYFNLPDGDHTLTLKAWDVFNNSGEASINFTVKRNIVLAVDEVLAYPNPSGADVWFRFGHNQFDGKFDVELSVYSSSGVLVRTIGPERVISEGYTAGNIHWDGRTNDGSPARAGLYLCRLMIRDRNGYTSGNTVKVVLVR
ncbi:type IX secretion system sortase PorU [Lentimicrobium sp.]|uniref:type IX secretion system sortase PorU n=1 Tax=Lentimicrobium sp. TaxID=2034841 RepID=UPI002CB50E80|nr:type IX secretion system sortase PorU [Lentimicrobium sp.]HRW68781.1 type IX secretion system sortase PorU [Lentimicrobium sp.]